MYGYHRSPTCYTNVRYGMTCCGNPLATMLEIQGIMDGNMGEVIAGEMMGGDIGFMEAVVAEELFDGGW